MRTILITLIIKYVHLEQWIKDLYIYLWLKFQHLGLDLKHGGSTRSALITFFGKDYY